MAKSLLQDEKWLPVIGYENIYEVSNLGNVRAMTRKARYVHSVTHETHYREVKGKTIKPQISNNGYMVVYLNDNGCRKRAYVHRLVAESFLGLTHGMVVDHKDFDKTNNRLSNLQCVTQKQNINLAVERMRKPRERYKQSNTGVKYISKRTNGSYRFSVGRLICKHFKTLEEAIAEKEVFFGGKKFIAG